MKKRLSLLVSVCLLVILIHSCKKDANMSYFDSSQKDTSADFKSWTHIDSIYPNNDSIILASYQLSDSIILISTRSGISYFNTYRNKIDSFVSLSTYPNYYGGLSIINKYVSSYAYKNNVLIFDNKNLSNSGIKYEISPTIGYPVMAMQGNRFYYQYNLQTVSQNTGLWTIKYLDFNIDSSNGASTYIQKIDEQEINITLPDSFRMSYGGVLNSFWTFDSSLFATYFNYYYRINHDGTYKRLTWNGKDFYPNNMFKIGSTLFALSNAYLAFDKYLFYSNDNGDTWNQYPNNDDYLDYSFVRNSVEFNIENQDYLYGGWGAFVRFNYSNGILTTKNLAFTNIFPLNINAVYPVASKYLYALSASGIWILNKDVFTNQ